MPKAHVNVDSKRRCLIILFGALGPLLIPPAHIFILRYIWADYRYYVDRNRCTCSCWDTVFKGVYEEYIASYKHLYFNATENTFKIWVITVLAILALYEALCYIIKVILFGHVRYSMVLLFVSSIFSHYYSWWTYLNYLNDEFYSQWDHQLFFTWTELVSTALVLHLANASSHVTNKKIVTIVAIACVHIYISTGDQFLTNVVHGQGFAHQVVLYEGFHLIGVILYIESIWALVSAIFGIVRDIFFMVCDFLHLIVPFLLLVYRHRELPFYKKSAQLTAVIFSDLIYLIAIVIVSGYFCYTYRV